MKDVLISIIVPAYNIELYIARCLDSILAQKYKKIEIIVVDDGSTDRTGKIIDHYASLDSRIIPIHKDNGGVTSARIEGIRCLVKTPELLRHYKKQAITRGSSFSTDQTVKRVEKMLLSL